MKQVLSLNKALIASTTEIIAIDHPSTIFTDDDVDVNLFTNQLILEGFTTDKVDNTLISVAESNINVEIIHIENEPRTNISDLSVAKLIAQGSTIITVDDER
jgi:hypothetical protein